VYHTIIAFFFTIAIIALNFSVPAICLVLLTLLNDGTVLTISYDKVIPAKKPETWKLPVIYGISVVIGVIITVALFGIYFIYSVPIHGETNLFGYKWSDQCYYSIGPFPNTNITGIVDHVRCSPACPGVTMVGENKYTCGDYVGWSELMTIIYLALSVGGQLTVFVSRTRHSFWSRRPGYALTIACIGAQLCATLISVYLPYTFKIDSYVGIPLNGGGFISTEVVMNGIDWKMAGYVWVYSIILFIVSDFAKVYFYYSMDNDNVPDEEDVITKKRQKKMFLPAVEQTDKKRKNTNASRH